MNSSIYKRIINASMANDVERIKKDLSLLDLRREEGFLDDIYREFKYLGKHIVNFSTKEENKNLMSDLLRNAIINNNIELCKYLMESKDLRIHPSLEDKTMWVQIITTGSLDIVKYLVGSPTFSGNGKTLVKALESATYRKDLEILKYLIDDLKMPYHDNVMQALKEYYRPNSPLTRFSLFSNSCRDNNKEWVDFILEHKELRDMLNCLSFFNGLKGACHSNELEMLGYLLRSDKVPYKVYQDYDPKELLKMSANKGSIDVLKYLIFDLGINKPDNLDEFFELTTIPKNSKYVLSTLDAYKKTVDTIKEFFEKRDFYEGLEINLDSSSEIKKRMKI